MSSAAQLFRTNTFKAVALCILSIALVSCESVGYYSQAARGQLAIVTGRQDIDRLLQQQDLSDDLAEKFRLVRGIRDFAAEELGLPVGAHYSTYVDVGREHVVWNVFAAPEFSIDAVSWCYPIAGCVSYRGYFNERSAQLYATKLEEDGFDVYTGGVDAYSTLGWFEDSLLSTVINRPDYQLAGLIFHELAHQVVYLPGDTTFNESFATAVEREGVRRWLNYSNDSPNIDAAELNYTRQEQFVSLVTEYRDLFEALYQQAVDEESMRSQKAQLQQSMRDSYELLKQQWEGYGGYDGWFSRSLNNAQLLTVASYNDLLPFFSQILVEVDQDLPRFFDEVERISKLSALEREELISISD